jgi:hypothetical protein
VGFTYIDQFLPRKYDNNKFLILVHYNKTHALRRHDLCILRIREHQPRVNLVSGSKEGISWVSSRA